MPLLRSPVGCFIIALVVLSTSVSTMMAVFNSEPTQEASQHIAVDSESLADIDPDEAYEAITDAEMSLEGDGTLLPAEDLIDAAPDEAAITDTSEPSVPANENIIDQIKRGDNLATIFARNGLKPDELHLFNRTKEARRFARRLQPGKQVEIVVKNNEWTALKYKSRLGESDVAYRENGQLRLVTELDALLPKTRTVSGVIESSLYKTAQAANMPGTVIMKLSDLFVRDVNFNSIRSGDSFRVVLEDQINDQGKTVRTDVVVAELIHKGETHKAFRYQHNNGETAYYDSNGKNRSYTLKRNPVKNSRVTSHFSYRRMHPILKVRRPHLGVDIAAPSGTPVQAAGDGVVTHVGYKKGYGRTVIIKHDSTYTTLYAHLKSYRRGLKKGTTVKQASTIAYLGNSGLSTGPHLHYEIRVKGKPRNPMNVKLPTAAPLTGQMLADFKRTLPSLEAKLNSTGGTDQTDRVARDGISQSL